MPPVADLLLRSARLLGEREPSDVLVSGGAVARIAPGLEPGRAEALDLEGRTLIRGLRDEHVHFTQWTLATRRLDLGTASSAAEVAELVAAVDITGDDVIVGVGFRDGLWPDARRAGLSIWLAGGTPWSSSAGTSTACG